MKKILYSLFALSVVSFTSCVKEEFVEDRFSSDGKMQNIVVSFDNDAVGTKCDAGDADSFLGETMYVTETGDTLYISAYLSDMENPMDFSSDDVESCGTKSTLIGSSNFGTAAGYTSFSLDVHKNGESGIYSSVDKQKTSTAMKAVTISYTGGSTDYKWSFDKSYFWPTDGKALNFCSYGPSAVFTDTECVNNISWNKDSNTFSFDYTTPSASADTCDAQNQKDIIVGVNNQVYTKGAANNVNLTLRHPLMAVRFVLGNIFGKIEYISLENFYSKGTVSVTKDTLAWTNLSEQASFLQTYDMFDATKYTDEQKAAGTVELDKTSGKTRNFIIIPQQLPDNASMGIKVGNNLHPIILSFDKIVGDGLTKDWSKYAGKVLTFRVSSKKANLVSVDITDNVSGCVKNNIKVFNDGKSDLYVRAVLVGNWLNSKGNILAAWDESLPYGEFDGKNPLTDASAFPNVLPSNWVYNDTDGFYYYKKILPSGYRISQNLFDKFELTDKPKVENSEDPDIQLASFEMAILVQAVAAVDPEGGDDVKYSARTAWGIDGSFLSTEKDTGAKME